MQGTSFNISSSRKDTSSKVHTPIASDCSFSKYSCHNQDVSNRDKNALQKVA